MSQPVRAPFVPFALEHYQSLWEQTVDINLADSSVQCLTTREWLDDAEREALDEREREELRVLDHATVLSGQSRREP